MRYVLAIVAFVLALPFLGYGGMLTSVLIFGDVNADLRLIVAIAGVALFIGLAFLVAGVAMLATKPRAK